jgi:hypothetical protein
MLFPTDRLTAADPSQLTGRRIRLSLVNCFEAPSTCDEISLLNGLDGWSVNPRMTLAFTGRVALDSITRSSAFVLPLGDGPAEPIGLSRLVWDPEGTTLYAKPERVLRQARPHAIVVTSRVRDEQGQPLRPAKGLALDARLAKRLDALGISPGEVVAASVFTTRSVTAGLEQMREQIVARPAPQVSFTLAPGGARSVYHVCWLRGPSDWRCAQTGYVTAPPPPFMSPSGVASRNCRSLRSRSGATRRR